MRLPDPVRKLVRRALGPAVIRCVRHIGVPKAKMTREYQALLEGRKTLEIGGPSDIFAYDGSVPVYSVLASVDNCLFSRETMWTGKTSDEFYYDAQRRQGRQFICDATQLDPIADASYECVLASHCLEHIANPLKALQEFRRVLRPGGLLLAILPHKDATFDWRRPLTELSHIEQDYARNTPEDDLTHLSEVLALHDIRKDPGAGPMSRFRERCLQNSRFRIMHHHTFDTSSAVELVKAGGFGPVQVENVKPFHIVVLAQLAQRFCQTAIDHAA